MHITRNPPSCPAHPLYLHQTTGVTWYRSVHLSGHSVICQVKHYNRCVIRFNRKCSSANYSQPVISHVTRTQLLNRCKFWEFQYLHCTYMYSQIGIISHLQVFAWGTQVQSHFSSRICKDRFLFNYMCKSNNQDSVSYDCQQWVTNTCITYQ